MRKEMHEALKELQNVCKEAKYCGKCPFFIKNGPDDDGYYDTLCMFELAPVNWNLELLEEEED